MCDDGRRSMWAVVCDGRWRLMVGVGGDDDVGGRVSVGDVGGRCDGDDEGGRAGMMQGDDVRAGDGRRWAVDGRSGERAGAMGDGGDGDDGRRWADICGNDNTNNAIRSIMQCNDGNAICADAAMQLLRNAIQ